MDVLPIVKTPVSLAADQPGMDESGVPVTTGRSEAESAPRRVSVQVPGSVLLLPLMAGAFYFFAFFAGNEPAGSSGPSVEPAGALARSQEPMKEPSLRADGTTPASRDFSTLLIEEPPPTELRSPAGASPERPAPGASSAAASARQLDRARKEAEARDLAEMRERVEVVVYSTTWCPACRSLRDYLVKRGIRATEYDIERNRSAQARQRELNPRGGVPTVEIDGQVLVGFSARGIEAALDRAARARLQRL